ncbi:hypothetical protein HVPorG_04631 [Roseomonas mucosa]|uniref:Uncharacterized protein n=1 Tax=Roseomonas mucosa TaxID=207340 RepID=A0A4Y1N2F9_9PROT|nr:hypothetical protein RADP37_04631 [Roseomonas mucosa]QDD96189.1 hypothetical protein HVIM_04631 [Roseomonas mucosa]QDE01190.1 hypothetical protein ADP8_04631 [Roseomonas mucosa]QDJ10920.1 hypothetical protein HVPorG_04631 [Roseomonas mucosa]UZO93478.1 Hypothetical protein RMP42_04631 [Roseomonas mucosa]
MVLSGRGAVTAAFLLPRGRLSGRRAPPVPPWPRPRPGVAPPFRDAATRRPVPLRPPPVTGPAVAALPAEARGPFGARDGGGRPRFPGRAGLYVPE